MIAFRNPPDFGNPYTLAYSRTHDGHVNVSLHIVSPDSTFDLTQPNESYFDKNPTEKSKWPSRKWNKFYNLTEQEFHDKFIEP